MEKPFFLDATKGNVYPGTKFSTKVTFYCIIYLPSPSMEHIVSFFNLELFLHPWIDSTIINYIALLKLSNILGTSVSLHLTVATQFPLAFDGCGSSSLKVFPMDLW